MTVLLLIAVGCLSSTPGTQLRIIREIRKAGGSVLVIPPRRVGWLGPIVGSLPDAFGEVYSVSLANVPARKHWLLTMRHWKRLSSLWLNRAALEDADLLQLASNSTITELYLNGNTITDQGLQNLGSKPYLRRLELNWTRIQKLEPLRRQFPRLHNLKLRGSSVSDADLTGLVGLHRLRWVDLSRTAVTDKGLLTLPRIPQLNVIELQGTRTTSQGAFRLQAALPNSFVYSSDGGAILPAALRR